MNQPENQKEHVVFKIVIKENVWLNYDVNILPRYLTSFCFSELNVV